MITLYRAMCPAEAEETLKSKSPSWNSRFKWYSRDRDWIESRVRDGKFNNSKFVADRYSVVIEHQIREEDLMKFSKVGAKELMLDRRRANSVKFIEVKRETF